MGLSSLFRHAVRSSKVVGGLRRLITTSGRPNWLLDPPMLMVPPLFGDRGRVENNLHLIGGEADTRFRKRRADIDCELKHMEVVGISHGWLSLYNPMSHVLYLVDPIEGRSIKLPPLPGNERCGGVSRVVLSHSPDDRYIKEEVRVLIIFGGARRIAMCDACVSKSWTVIADKREIPSKREYEDIVYVRRQSLLYCLTRNPSHLEVWDLKRASPFWGPKWLNFDEPNFCWPAQSREHLELKKRCWRTKYMLPSRLPADHFYVVVRHICPPTRTGSILNPYKTVDFDVYSFEVGSTLRLMKSSLERHVIFLGLNQAWSYSYSPTYPHLKSDSIYFTDDNRGRFGDGCHDNGVFDYKNNTFTTCCGKCPLDRPDAVMDSAPLWLLPDY